MFITLVIIPASVTFLAFHEPKKQMEIWFTTENAVKAVRKNVSDKQLLDFRLSCRIFLKAVAKLLNKTAVQFPLANNLAFLDPRLVSDTVKNKTCLKSVLCLLVHCNRLAVSES